MKRFLAVFSILCSAALAFAQGVDRVELESVNQENSGIVFKNYEGPHAVISTQEQIFGIGRELGTPITADRTAPREIGSSARYQVIHCVDPSETGKLDADIFILGPGAGVDHITNVRRIVSGFLREAYGYDATDADTLATFITVYNAVYRGNLDVFQGKYKNAVTRHLRREAVGISTNYEEWPGRTQMVIPLLSVAAGGLSTVDTSAISGKDVVSNLREEDGRGVDVRKNLVDLKEREADAAETEARAAQKEVVAARQEAAKAQQELENAKQSLVDAREDTEKAAEDALKKELVAAAEPTNQAAQGEAEEARNALSAAQEKLAEIEKEVEKNVEKAEAASQALADKIAEAEEKQAFADKKNAEALSERIAIAADQQKNKVEEAALRRIDTTYALVLADEKELTSRLVLVNTANGETVKESPLNTIRSRTIYPVRNAYLAIAGSSAGMNQAVTLVLIDSDSMQILSQSKEQVSASSPLYTYNNRYYAILQEGTEYYLGAWSADLTLLAKSAIKVHPASPLVVTDKGAAVTTERGTLALLDATTLEEKK